VTRRSPHLTALVASLLALAVAAGVSTPRLRTGGRDRAARTAALAGSSRSDQPCAWVEPDDDFAQEILAPAGDLVLDLVTTEPAPDAGHAVPVAAATVVVPQPASVLLTGSLLLPADRPASRPAAARGPPALLS
jgi:hypothetical protein